MKPTVNEEDIVKAEKKLLGNALDNAQEKAKSIADKFNLKLGNPIRVVEQQQDFGMFYDESICTAMTIYTMKQASKSLTKKYLCGLLFWIKDI